MAKGTVKRNRKAAPSSLKKFADAQWQVVDAKNRGVLRVVYIPNGKHATAFTLAVIPYGTSGYGHIDRASADEMVNVILAHGDSLHREYLKKQKAKARPLTKAEQIEEAKRRG